jgi:polyvinyl alcohol dehydrogenase (cytochrome)
MNRRMDIACGIAAAGLLMTMPPAQAQDWTMGGHDLSNTRNQPITTISAANVGKLTKKWVFEAGGLISATPAVANGVVYFPDGAGNFYALNASDGSVIWQATVATWTNISGDSARNDPAIAYSQRLGENLLILGNQAGFSAKWSGAWVTKPGATVMAVKASDGKAVWVTQVEAFPAAAVTSSPVVYNSVVYVGIASAEEGIAAIPSYPCCTSRGSVVALDLNTGKVLWQTYMVPNNGGVPGGYSGGAIWGSTPVVDAKRNSLYVGVGNNYSVPITDEVCATANPAANCYAKDDYFDSLVALDLTTGAIKWASHAWPYDAWNVACITPGEPATNNCPKPTGPDYDFGGSGPNMFSRNNNSGNDTLVGVGQKSGIYWAFNPNNGNVVWKTQVGPGSSLGGIEWGTATDGTRIYVPISNYLGIPYTFPSETTANGGSWAALDPKTGEILWQTATPGSCLSALGQSVGCMALGPASVAGGVVFAGSMDTNPNDNTMFALDAKTGKILWQFAAGSAVVAAPAIVGDSLYWGSGPTPILSEIGFPINNKLFKFSISQ